MADEKNRIFISTAISYTNGPPHLGHAYEVVLADVFARWHRLMNRPVLFSTGTDEHGFLIHRWKKKVGNKER